MNRVAIVFLLFFGLINFAFNLYSQQISSKAKGHFNKGLSAFKKEKYEDALKEFEQAKSLAENWTEVYYQLGLTYEKLGMYNNAIDSLTTYLIRAKPENFEEIKQFMDDISKKEAEAYKKREIFYDYNLLPNHWTVIEDSDPRSMCLPSSGNGYRKVGDDKYEVRVYQGVGYGFEPLFEWVPIRFRDDFFEYTFTYYQCILVSAEDARKDLGMQPKCPWVINVKGEIIQGEPPIIKFTCNCEAQTVKPSKKKLTRILTIKETGFKPSPLGK